MNWKNWAETAICTVSVAAAVITCTQQKSSASPPQLVYVCSAQPCSHSQELTVSDNRHAPIFSVGEFGGAGVFGDNFSIYAPGRISSPVMVWSYASPAAYGKTSCTPPETWYSPSAIWICRNGKFTEDVKL
jgi:hypothetical protein